VRFVIEVIRLKKTGFYEFPGVGPVLIDKPGYYARTQFEIAGPFDDAQEARRLTAMVIRRELKPSREVLPPIKMWTRVVEI